MTTYATAKAAYRELREAIGGWASAQAFTRTPGTEADWQKTVPTERRLRFRFEGDRFANADVGNNYHGYIQLEPLATQTSDVIRQATFSCCLIQTELDELSRVQGAINRRRQPVPSYLRDEFDRDTLMGRWLRQQYDQAPPYREGHMIHFAYQTLDDARDLAVFIARVLPQALERFMQELVAKPIDTTPAHLKPKWLRDLK